MADPSRRDGHDSAWRCGWSAARARSYLERSDVEDPSATQRSRTHPDRGFRLLVLDPHPDARRSRAASAVRSSSGRPSRRAIRRRSGCPTPGGRCFRHRRCPSAMPGRSATGRRQPAAQPCARSPPPRPVARSDGGGPRLPKDRAGGPGADALLWSSMSVAATRFAAVSDSAPPAVRSARSPRPADNPGQRRRRRRGAGRITCRQRSTATSWRWGGSA